jgi:PAS domain S-box-containing protein
VTALRRATGELQTNFRRLQLIEASNRAERDRLDLVLDSVSDPIVVTDPDGRLVRMNRHAERLFTTSEPHPRGPAHQAVRENSRHLARFAASLLENERDTRLRGHLSLTEPGSLEPVPVEASAGKLLTEDGELSGLVTILRDRTEALEKTRLYAELQRASAELERKVRDATLELVHRNELLQRQHLQLEQASALKTQFLANMSHELRTPLNAILGYTSMMLQGVSGDLPASARKGLGRVESNARHLLGVINDILDISRIEAGRMPLSLSEFSLPELVAEVMGEVEPIIARTRLEVRAEVDPEMAPLRCDRQKLKQVLQNLLTNALKFTPAGSVRVEARLAAETDQVSLAVADTGIGIAAADHERIFEDFRQADDSTTREYGGTGLGLAIVRRLVGMLAGQVSLASAPGQGSRFTVTLPRRLRKR